MNPRQIADRKMAELRAAKAEVKTRKVQVSKATKSLKDHLKAQHVLQHVSQRVQETVHARIAGVVSKCLKAVFEDPYTFHVIFEKKRGKTEARLEFRRRGLVLRPEDGVGGSVLDVASFALRLACLGLHRPRRRRFVVLDESFRGLSDRQGNKERIAALLETLAVELDFQIVQVTHDRGLRAGRVVEVF